MKGIFYSIIIIQIVACSTIGTKTLYKTEKPTHIQNIVFSALYEEDKLKAVYPNISERYNESVKNSIFKYSNFKVNNIPDRVDFNAPDVHEVNSLCNLYNADALLLTKLKFINVSYSVAFVPIAKNYDTEVEMKLVYKNGDILYHTKHNTLKGNSYISPPPVEKTVNDGIDGAMKRILREFNK